MKKTKFFFLTLLAGLLMSVNAGAWTKPDPSKTYVLRNAHGAVNNINGDYDRCLIASSASATSVSGQQALPLGEEGYWKFESASSDEHEYYLKNVLTGKYLYVATPSAGASLMLDATNKSTMYLDDASSPVSGVTNPTLISFGSSKAFGVHGSGPQVWSGQGGGNQWLLIEASTLPERDHLYKIKGYNGYYMLGTGTAGTGRVIPTAQSATDETTLWWYYSPQKNLIGYSNSLAVYQTQGLQAAPYSETVDFYMMTTSLTKYTLKTNFSGSKFMYNHGDGKMMNRNSSRAVNYCDYEVEQVPANKYYRIVFDNTPDGSTITYNSVTHDSKMPFFATSEGGTIEKGDLSAKTPGGTPSIEVDAENRVITLSVGVDKQAAIDAANAVLAFTGVGYPGTTARETLNEAISTFSDIPSPKGADLAVLEAAVRDYKLSSDIVYPENKKVYTITAWWENKTRPFYWKGSLETGTYTGDDASATGEQFVFDNMTGNKYSMLGSNGYYFAWQAAGKTSQVSTTYSDKVLNLLNKATNMDDGSSSKSGNVNITDNALLFGLFGMKGYCTDDAKNLFYFLFNGNDNQYHNASASMKYYSTSGNTSFYRVTEVTGKYVYDIIIDEDGVTPENPVFKFDGVASGYGNKYFVLNEELSDGNKSKLSCDCSGYEITITPDYDNKTVTFKFVQSKSEAWTALNAKVEEANTLYATASVLQGTNPGYYLPTTVEDLNTAITNANDELKAASPNDETMVTLKGELETAMAACTMIMPVEGKYYVLRSAYSNGGANSAFMYVDAEHNMLWKQTPSVFDRYSVWTFIPSDTKFKIQNCGDGQQIPDNHYPGNDLTTVASGYAYNVQSLGGGQFGLMGSEQAVMVAGTVEAGTVTEGHIQVSGVPSLSNFNAWTIEEVTTQEVTISAAGFATACFGFDSPGSRSAALVKAVAEEEDVTDQVKVYYISYEEESLVKTEITNVALENMSFRNGVALRGIADKTVTATFFEAPIVGADASSNCLVGNTSEQTFNSNAYTWYILANGDKGVGFYWQVADGASATCAAYKAVLALPAGSKIKGFSLDDDPTGINDVDVDADVAIFNLAGQKINKIQKGVNIVNGRKVLY